MARWALVIGFGLLGAVTALAAIMIVMFPQPGNVGLLTVTAIVSTGIAFYIWRSLKRKL
jgi:drug/metabolite transporter (DMT)-like permease